MSDLNDRQRLWDLVRYQRGELLDAGLITEREYADLAADGGSVARLEGYDSMRAELAALRRERDALRGLVAGCAPYVHKAEHVIGCQARYGEKTCACGLFGLRDRIDAALRGEGGK